MAKVNDPKKAARRARVIASDIAIYPDIQKKIERGIKNDNLFEELDDVLREARQHFKAHVSDDIIENTNIFEKAIIDIVFANTAHIDSEIW
jgi:thermostable 8-oxoguanine DNA glycosylase